MPVATGTTIICRPPRPGTIRSGLRSTVVLVISGILQRPGRYLQGKWTVSKATRNEIALTILLAGFTLVFVIVCVTLIPMADYTNIEHPGTYISIAAILSLFVCLIPTTIGGLLSAIGIAGMDRALRANVITKSFILMSLFSNKKILLPSRW